MMSGGQRGVETTTVQGRGAESSADFFEPRPSPGAVLQPVDLQAAPIDPPPRAPCATCMRWGQTHVFWGPPGLSHVELVQPTCSARILQAWALLAGGGGGTTVSCGRATGHAPWTKQERRKSSDPWHICLIKAEVSSFLAATNRPAACRLRRSYCPVCPPSRPPIVLRGARDDDGRRQRKDKTSKKRKRVARFFL